MKILAFLFSFLVPLQLAVASTTSIFPFGEEVCDIVGQHSPANEVCESDNSVSYIFKSSFPEVKIVGGNVAPHIYPYMASLQVKNGKKWEHFCGASLIKPTILLTAAHCVKYLPAKPGTNYRAVLGKYVLSSKNTQGVYTRSLTKIVIHPDYNTMNNDLALITIPIISNIPNINITMPTPPPSTMLTVIGWGYTTEGSGKTSDVLMQVNVPIVSLTICKKSYPSVTSQNVCAGYQQGGKDSCSGDSGGPLFFNQSGNIQQVGIVSYGKGCAEPNYYGVYTSVSYYRSWIETNSKSLSLEN